MHPTDLSLLDRRCTLTGEYSDRFQYFINISSHFDMELLHSLNTFSVRRCRSLSRIFGLSSIRVESYAAAAGKALQHHQVYVNNAHLYAQMIIRGQWDLGGPFKISECIVILNSQLSARYPIVLMSELLDILFAVLFCEIEWFFFYDYCVLIKLFLNFPSPASNQAHMNVFHTNIPLLMC